ncbi:tyrosine-type recombinase/integrase [Fictibacillus iocasae]|uniref:Tyrosine-type recombinase/integrase n=1 Tax=Fictibacillus iocasae TaxID=2715437 RepID=A0ABW2NP57_9BACL
MDHFPHLPGYAQHYLLALLSDGRKESTLRRYYYDLHDFFAWMRVNFKDDALPSLSHLKKEEVQEYLRFLTDQRKYSTSTMTRVETVLKRLGVYLVRTNALSANPFHIERTVHAEELTDDDFVSAEEINQLFSVLSSLDGLTENQLKHRPLLIARNRAILHLLVYHGLTLKELSQIKMKDLRLHQRELRLETRICQLQQKDQQLLSEYLNSIPEPVRPRLHSNDPLFAAFDYQRGTYRWDYVRSSPKPLTIIAIQKMLRQEIRRGGLRSGLSSQHFRRTFILSLIEKGAEDHEMQQMLGLKALLSIKRYRSYAQQR